MKHIVLGSIGALIAALLSPHVVHAQGTLYLSSLAQTYTGMQAVGSDSWLAAPFVTGSSLGGYPLDSVQLGMANASGNPNGFSVMVYTNSGNAQGVFPGNTLGALTGSVSPSTTGVYIYTPVQSITLLPRTHYFVVLTAASAVGSGAFDWALSTFPATTTSEGWLEGNEIRGSADGISGWSLVLPNLGIGQLAIYATPVPEPGVLGLVVLGGLLLMRHRR